MGTHIRPRLAITIAIIAMALALRPFAQSAWAAPPIRENFANTVAGTQKTECLAGTDQCIDTSVVLFVDDGAARVCLDIYTYIPTGGLLGYETGCAPVGPGGSTFDVKSLSGAAFSATAISLQRYVCGAGLCEPTGTPRSAVVSGTFTGIGELSTFRANSKQTFGNCTMYFVGKGSSRQADASVTIDGQPLDPPGFLSASSQKTKVICR